MSDEPTQKDQSASEATTAPGEWVMPEPIFRISDGRTPKSAARSAEDDVETEIPNQEQIDITLDQSDEFHNAETEEMPAAVRPKPLPRKNGGCAKSFLFIIGVVGAGLALVVILLVYFLFYFRPAETGTF